MTKTYHSCCEASAIWQYEFMYFLETLLQYTGKKRALLAFALGVCATLSLAPFFVLPLIFVSVTLWYLMLERAETPRAAAWIGWWWGLGFFISGLYWMSASLLVDAAHFAWMIPFCLFGLNGILAIYPALASYTFKRFTLSEIAHAEKKSISRVLLFVFCWSLSEWLRSVLFTGFPWNLVGYSSGVWTPLMQGAALFGIHGLSLLVMLAAVSPVLLIRKHYGSAIMVWGVWTVLLAWGIMRIPSDIPLAHKRDGSPIELRIVQAAIPQSLKWEPSERINHIKTQFKLSTSPAEHDIDIVIWPESAVPLALNNEPILVQDLAELAPYSGALITGAIHVERDASDANLYRYYNSVFTVNRDGIGDVYDKHHLVPFGEYVPFRRWLPIEKIAPGIGDFARGPGPEAILLENNLPPFSPLICYEAIFPAEVYRDAGGKVAWMVNLTNDGWFGNTSGPYQHFQMTRFRAVEYGMPLVRAANTGISAVVDAYGRVNASLGLNEQGVLDAPLPAALPPTFFSLFHNNTYWVMLLSLLMCGLVTGYAVLHTEEK